MSCQSVARADRNPDVFAFAKLMFLLPTGAPGAYACGIRLVTLRKSQIATAQGVSKNKRELKRTTHVQRETVGCCTFVPFPAALLQTRTTNSRNSDLNSDHPKPCCARGSRQTTTVVLGTLIWTCGPSFGLRAVIRQRDEGRRLELSQSQVAPWTTPTSSLYAPVRRSEHAKRASWRTSVNSKESPGLSLVLQYTSKQVSGGGGHRSLHCQVCVTRGIMIFSLGAVRAFSRDSREFRDFERF